ncbi:Low molecular weight protein tyrosine phosphatase [Marinobacterium lacunae]|uniref:protein-tyrosine-phosphatase n=1 Tax=Marinobacterium lacunae TaxID=1232683 RepID=A0A081FTY6_9GAMM|nr:low molecular weight protein-tyrosine-phosphatase [Marinobacterium lacunae]KEA61991.1 Low molecular weight protein tyrosine phosphatase [Marinobacterium lacunae]MBR9882823.1 low molecular weight phosphotyrosine protein phosphatase [Oceanospirillales bacterium]
MSQTGVLFVCLGNICRSPTAEGVFDAKLKEHEDLASMLVVDSAGTAAYHVGNPPDSRSAAIAARRGYDLSRLRARAVDQADFSRYRYILAMDQQNLDNLKSICPADFDGHLGLFLDFAGMKNAEVPDPYYTRGDKGFEQVLDLVEAAADGLLGHLREELLG